MIARIYNYKMTVKPETIKQYHFKNMGLIAAHAPEIIKEILITKPENKWHEVYDKTQANSIIEAVRKFRTNGISGADMIIYHSENVNEPFIQVWPKISH
jgi:hypothetical protein